MRRGTGRSSKHCDSCSPVPSFGTEIDGPVAHENFNGLIQEGIGAYHYNYQEGRRHSAADAYLKPIIHRNNLSITVHAHVTRILFEGNRAVGAEYIHDHQLKKARADSETILSGGAFNSPQILLCSGIGPAAQLDEYGSSLLMLVAHRIVSLSTNSYNRTGKLQSPVFMSFPRRRGSRRLRGLAGFPPTRE